MSVSDGDVESSISGIIAEMNNCGRPGCGKSLKGPSGTVGVKVGFRLFHAKCAQKYQADLEAREKAPEGPSRGNVTVLPECRNTEGWYDWTHGARNPMSMQNTLFERCLASTDKQFVWL